MTRPLWLPIASVISAVLVWAILLGYVHAEAKPDVQPLSIRPHFDAEKQKPKPRCFHLRTIIVTLKLPDGQIAIFPVTRAVAC